MEVDNADDTSCACAKEGGGWTKGCFVFTVTTREAFKRETVGDRTNRKRCDAAIR